VNPLALKDASHSLQDDKEIVRTAMSEDRRCVAVGCSVLQYVAVFCIVLQCVAVDCSGLQCAAVCCNVSQCVAVLAV